MGSYQAAGFALSVLVLSLSQAVFAAEVVLDEVVVTAPKMSQPLVVETNPKAPRQPVPAHDGADYLKNIPGFAVMRKGGTDGEAVLRGMAGSRLGILVDGQNVLGGCNFRMDAPTAYVFPEIFDVLTVRKGPSVLYGPGNSAGAVLFDRKPVVFTEAGYRLHSSLLLGSAGRHDEALDGKVGNAQAYAQLVATNSQAGDYKDGNGNVVHSAYRRYNVTAAAGWTPDQNTRLEVSGIHSDGHAAYADRGMDGTKFLREGVGVQFERKNISPLLAKVEVKLSNNDVDHIMDDQTLRTPGMMGYANLKRSANDARASATLDISEAANLTLGVDHQQNEHSGRNAGKNGVYNAWSNDARFKQTGLFGELDYQLSQQQRINAGLRVDSWKVQDQRGGMIMNWNAMGMIANPTSGQQRSETLNSGFVRYEQQASKATTWFAGFGHTERFPDYWELISKQSMTNGSAFHTQSEKTNQLDVGLVYQTHETSLGLSAFYNKIDDFILVDYTSKKNTGASRNINASSYGLEADFAHQLNPVWKTNATLAYVHGDNHTDNTALAQLPPLEARLGLSYDDKTWSVGGLLRMVAGQDRFDLGKGNIAGKDLGAASGFAVFSVNGGWKANQKLAITAGIDNLFDRNYAESISRANGNGMGGSIPGYTPSTRVNEPGRTAWTKLTFKLD